MTDQLRDEIAALFRSAPGEGRLGDEPPGTIADAVLAELPGYVRRLMDSAEALRRERDEARVGLDALRDATYKMWWEISRLRREVEFEANGVTSHPVSAWPRPLCSCVTPEQAETARAGGFSPPQCNLHPDGGAQ